MLKLNNNDLKKLYSLFEVREDNIFVSSLINEYFESDKEEINSFNETKTNFINSFNLEKSKESETKMKKYELDNIVLLNELDYKNDEYFKIVRPKEFKNKSYHLYYKNYDKYECFIYDESKITSEYKEINKIGCFKDSFKFLALDKDDVTWMSVIPHEINTMKNDIKDAKGNVLIYGLGLGYFLFSITNKNEVKSIKVIEKDKNIIDIFNKNLFPFFKNKEKIEIINDDAFCFNKKIKSNEFDYIYTDLWHDPLDGLEIYHKLIREEKENIIYRYWIEKTILSYLRRIVVSLFIEEIEGYSDKEYLNNPKDYETKLINSLHFYLKPIVFDSFDKINNLLKDASLKELLKNITIK